ncbi:putative bifunctional diguanylate cyclase/phosphodiesterase [Neptunomonas sp.]|uniref:putative bifunctional diguanylate cyclase/phosphodiesterase n=1 Tax=Neptunomonas sp. TaxID=1971898 RepID=UPI003563D5BD
MDRTRVRAITTNTLLCIVCLLVPLLLLNNTYIARWNWIIYDSMHTLLVHDASEQVVIVAVDDNSLQQLGRWPWSREVHTRFLQQVHALGVKAVGFDILFPEHETDQVDQAFSDEIRKMGRVVLAVAPEVNTQDEITSESLPIPILAAAADRLGHVDYELEIDGICRAVYLYAGLGSAHWPAFAYAVYLTAFQKQPEIKRLSALGSGWVREQPLYIPFQAKPDAISQVSFDDVLHGRVDSIIQDKILLVGATAAGLGDQLSTPVSGEHRRMPGVEVNAHLLESLIQQRSLEYASLAVQVIYTLSVIILFAFSLYFFGLSRAPVLFFACIVLTFVITFISLQFLRLWVPPFTALLGAVVTYFAWGWRSQTIVQGELLHLNRTLLHQGGHDPISSLPNRTILEKTLNQSMINAKLTGCLVSVYIINTGSLRAINDQLGFKAGDELLDKVAQRIQRVLGEGAVVAKINGEFAVVQDAAHELRIQHVGGRLLQVLQQPFEWGNKDYYLPPSIGVSVFPADGLTSDTLINHAFTAMHRAKADRKRGLLFFSQQMKQDQVQRSELESDLRNALVNAEFEVYYQPKVSATDRSIIGAEALLRWHHPVRGMVPPTEFIPLAEKQGIIVEIGAWVLRQACQQTQIWHDTGYPVFRIAVNVSAVQLTESDFSAVLYKTLDETGLNAQSLEIEVTETSLMTDVELTIRILEQIKMIGVGIAVDDFGTGYSSLNYLNMFPVDCLKIDRTFVKDLGTSSDSKDITLSIINMAHRLHLQVVAEGVETEAQATFMQENACEYLQGYLFGKPLPADEFTVLLSQK